MQIPTSTPEQIAEETEYVLKKLDISQEEWQKILDSPNKTVDDYPNEKRLKKILQSVKYFFIKKK